MRRFFNKLIGSETTLNETSLAASWHYMQYLAAEATFCSSGLNKSPKPALFALFTFSAGEVAIERSKSRAVISYYCSPRRYRPIGSVSERGLRAWWDNNTPC